MNPPNRRPDPPELVALQCADDYVREAYLHVARVFHARRGRHESAELDTTLHAVLARLDWVGGYLRTARGRQEVSVPSHQRPVDGGALSESDALIRAAQCVRHARNWLGAATASDQPMPVFQPEALTRTLGEAADALTGIAGKVGGTAGPTISGHTRLVMQVAGTGLTFAATNWFGNRTTSWVPRFPILRRRSGGQFTR